MIFCVNKHYDVILIGKEGENDAREIRFDFSAWKNDFGAGLVTILNKRKGDTSPYPVAVTYDGNIAIWKPNLADTDKAGAGFCELVYTVDDVIAKSVTFSTYVTPSLGEGSEEPPEPQQPWVDMVIEKAGEAVQAKEDAEDARDAAEGFADDAEQSAQSAEQSAQNAAQSADEAEGFAQNAEQSAQDAENAKQAIFDTTATGSVDANVGTPSVNVTKSIVEGHANIDFAFHNIKGERGEKGEPGGSFVTPDNYDGADDSTKIENAVADIVSKGGGTIVFDRQYVLTRDTILSNNSDSGITVTFMGLNELAGVKSGSYSFVGDEDFGNANGGFFFENLTFTGFPGNGACFKADGMIRITISSCNFEDYDSIVKIESSHSQSVRIDKCLIRHCEAIINSATGVSAVAYDTHITNNTIEWGASVCAGGIKYHGLYVTNNCIEGLEGVAFVFTKDCYGVDIANNFFEHNLEGTIDFTSEASNAKINVSIRNNNFVHTDEAGIPAVIVPPVDDFVGNITISNNSTFPAEAVLVDVRYNAVWSKKVICASNTGTYNDTYHKLNLVDFANILGAPGTEYILTVSCIGTAVVNGVIYAPVILTNFLSSTSYEVVGIYESTVLNVADNVPTTVLIKRANALELQSNTSGVYSGQSYVCRYTIAIRII